MRSAPHHIGAVAGDSGWDKADRQARYDSINKLTGA